MELLGGLAVCSALALSCTHAVATESLDEVASADERDRRLRPRALGSSACVRQAGVAANTRLDSQAKGLGEYLRAMEVDLPESLLS